MIVEVWTIKEVNPLYLLVPSNNPCNCEYCDHDHNTQEKVFFDVHNLLGKVSIHDIGKKVTYNTITKCFKVENDEQLKIRTNKI